MSSATATDRTFGTNVLWNMASLGFLAFAGLLLNFVIARFYGASALGLFNIVFALYIFLSQLGVLGIHFSVLRYVSEYATSDPDKAGKAVTGALMLVTAVSTAVTIAAVLATPLIGRIYAIEGIATAWLAILPGLWCFSINKVLLAVLNGAECMRAFAVLQALRYIFILLALACVLMIRPAAEWIVVVISAAEAMLLLVLAVVLHRMFPKLDWRGGRAWIRTHLQFGAQVFLSGTIGELNTRIDVLLLGSMLDSTRAGIYSVALLLAEGFAQAIVVMRNNINPVITRDLLGGDVQAFTRFARRISAWFALFMLVAGTLVVAGFALTVTWLLPDEKFQLALVPLAILIGGLVLASAYMPFGMILSQSGRPLEQTWFAGAVLASNAVFNILLIPPFGIVGAAVGTALSYVATALLLIFVMRRVYGIRIWV